MLENFMWVSPELRRGNYLMCIFLSFTSDEIQLQLNTVIRWL